MGALRSRGNLMSHTLIRVGAGADVKGALKGLTVRFQTEGRQFNLNGGLENDLGLVLHFPVVCSSHFVFSDLQGWRLPGNMQQVQVASIFFVFVLVLVLVLVSFFETC